MPETKDLTGSYRLLVGMDHGGGRRSSPGDEVQLSHVDAARALAQGTVQSPDAPSGDFDDPNYIPTEAEFLAEMKREYPRFLEHRTEQKARQAARRAESEADAEKADADKAKADAEDAALAALVAEEEAAKAKADAEAAVVATMPPATDAPPAVETPSTPPAPAKQGKNR